MTILSSAPQIATFICRIDSRSETHGRNSRILHAELETNVLEVHDEDRSVAHLSVIHPNMVCTGADISPKDRERVNVVHRVDADIRDEGRWAAIGMSRVRIVLEHPLGGRANTGSAVFVLLLFVLR